MNSENTVNCKCFHHFVIPALISLIGIIVLLGNLQLLTTHLAGLLWPGCLALIGLQKMFQHKCKCCVDHHHCHHVEGHEHK